MDQNNILNLNIVILKIEVDDDYYSIKYDWYANGKKKKASYESDYDNGMTPLGWKNELENGEAIRIALLQIAEDY